MKNTILTTYIIGNKEIHLGVIPENVEILNYNENTDIDKAKGKYISFIDSEDSISENYFNVILDKINKEKFDICYINYEINYNYKRKPKIRTENQGITNDIPIYNPYIWNYVFKKNKISKFKDFSIKKEDLKITSYISEQIYFHNQNRFSTRVLNMPTRRITVHYKNIIYMGGFCNGLFNGYITWLLELGKAFPNYKMTILYTDIHEVTLKRFSKYFECIKINNNINYTCDRLITTYSTYFYPTNIYSLEESYLFIHGNMCDYKDTTKYKDDIYDKYIAVSQVSRDRAKGYFPTDNIDYIYNPYIHDKSKIKPHLRLVSALRNSPEKGMDRIKQAAKILDEAEIPYTWQIFTDLLEPNQGGLIFRAAVANVIDYIADADYLVQLSSSEALSYSLTEALSSKVKIISTDLPAVREINLIDGENGFIIPFSYFEEENKLLLKEKLIEVYQKKDMKFNYHYEKSRFANYKNVLKK